MSRDDESAGPRSLAGLSEPGAFGPGAGDALHPFATADDLRYRELRVVGTGGLGTVLLAHDERLAREVALKRIGPELDEAVAAARFMREARLTARLDHPGIVPIHDAGLTADGRLYYTMRLIRGRTLAALGAEATTPEDRLALLTAVTAACHAVGYAHRNRVVHRDLKPANIMVGELGETQVVDWGLAEELEVAAASDGGRYVGTPAYLSPEVASGGAAVIAADVWALGVILFELVTGARRLVGTRDEILAALRGPRLAPAAWPDTCPAELRAIGDRAMAIAPAARYPDAQAMAADLEAFRDGRRVGAYAYSPLELARRFVRAWRWPLAVMAALVSATIGSLAVTAHRTERQRVRAVAAEASAQRELTRAEDSLGWALATSAVTAFEAGHVARAEVLAAHALRHGESADARGVLAATTAGGRPDRARRVAIPDCPWVVPAGAELALCLAPSYLELWSLAPPRRRWRRDLAFAGAIDLDEAWVIAWASDGAVTVLDGATGGERARYHDLTGVAQVVVNTARTRAALHDRHTLVTIDPATGARQVLGRVCGDRTLDAAAITNDEVWVAWVVCGDGQLASVNADGRVQPMRDTGFGTVRRPASALALSESEADLAIGGVGGDVMTIDLRGCFSAACAGRPDSELFAGVTTHAILHLWSIGNAVMAVPDHGDAVLLRAGLTGPLMRVPVDDGRVATFLEWDLAAGGAEWRLWDLPLDPAPRHLTGPTGITAGALARTGALLAVGGDRGEIVVWDPSHGQRVATLTVGPGTIRSLDFTADGRALVATIADGPGPAVRVFDTVGWAEAGPAAATTAGARAGWTIGPGLAIERRRGDQIERVGTAAGTVAVVASVDGRRLATAGPRRATVHESERGDVIATVEVRDGEIVALALSDEGRWLAAATTSGHVEIWDAATARLVARLRGHRQRATWVGFRGDALWSAGWDGVALRWGLAALEAMAATLVADAESRWGLTLDDALARQGARPR